MDYPHQSSVVALYEAQGASVADIVTAIGLPHEVVEIILREKSPIFRADQEMLARVGAGSMNDQDVPDRMFARVRQETFQLALDRNTPVYCRTGLLKFIWDKKRPVRAEGNGNTANVAVQVNLALQQARETLKAKLEIVEDKSVT